MIKQLFQLLKPKNMGYQNINAAAFNELAKQPNTVILDVRTKGEYSGGIIPKAQVGFDFLGGEFSRKASSLDKNKTYLVYCRSGNRSGAACSQLHNLGFEKVYNLSGGISGYRV